MNREFLALVAKINPQAWDALIPRYVGSRRFAEQAGEKVSLNPQPIPPGEARVGADLVAEALQHAIIVVGGRGGDVAGSFMEEVDDICGTGWRKWWPKPPRPPWWDDRAVFTGAALQAAALAGRFDHNPELQATLLDAAERFGDAAG